VRIWEYQPTMIHSKTIVADGLWASVGSMNFDNRSIAFNNETNLAVLDSAFGSEMDRTFLEDLRYSREIKLAEFRRRPTLNRVIEWGASMLTRIL
jgi:cardiolipin synthase A/B